LFKRTIFILASIYRAKHPRQSATAASLQLVPTWSSRTAKDNPLHFSLPPFLQSSEEDKECSLRLSHPNNSTRTNWSAKQGSGENCLDELQGFQFAGFSFPRAAPGRRTAWRAIYLPCAAANMLDKQNPLKPW